MWNLSIAIYQEYIGLPNDYRAGLARHFKEIIWYENTSLSKTKLGRRKWIKIYRVLGIQIGLL